MDSYLSSLLAAYHDKESPYHVMTPAEFRAGHELAQYELRANRRLVYLDLNFWINCREAIHQSSSKDDKVPAKYQGYLLLFSLLEEFISKEKIVCVLSSSLLDEMLKMPAEARITTAVIMDRLKCRHVLNNYRIAIAELNNIANALSTQPLFPYYYLSSIFEQNPVLSERFFEKNASNDNFLNNTAYALTLQYSVEECMRESDVGINPSIARLSESFNALKFSGPKQSYKQLLLEGLTSQIKGMHGMFPSQFSMLKDIDVTQHIPIFQEAAPFQYLLSSIYAALAADPYRKMKPNDYYDTMQSCVAIPYADYFFTEKSFKHLVTTGPIEQLNSYRAIVKSDLSEIIAILQSL